MDLAKFGEQFRDRWIEPQVYILGHREITHV